MRRRSSAFSRAKTVQLESGVKQIVAEQRRRAPAPRLTIQTERLYASTFLMASRKVCRANGLRK